MENVDRREEVFAEAIELLGKDIAMIHFKDFLRKDAGGQLAATGAGQGGMEDYRTILRFAKQEKAPYLCNAGEYHPPENAVECLNYLKSSTTSAEHFITRKTSASFARNGAACRCFLIRQFMVPDFYKLQLRSSFAENAQNESGRT